MLIDQHIVVSKHFFTADTCSQQTDQQCIVAALNLQAEVATCTAAAENTSTINQL